MAFPITSLYVLPLIPIFMLLFVRVSARRSALNASIGHADDTALHERIRHHGNFIEWVPLVLILMMLAEANGGNSVALHVAGGFLVLGRTIHPFGLRADNPSHPLRIAGNSLNLLAAAILTVLIAMARLAA